MASGFGAQGLHSPWGLESHLGFSLGVRFGDYLRVLGLGFRV